MSLINLHFGIRTKLLIPILLGFVLVIYALIAHWTPFFMAHERDDFIRHQRAILKTLEPSIDQDLLSRDYAALFSSLEYELSIHSRDWLYIELESNTGKRLFPLSGNPPANDNNTLQIKHTLHDAGENLGMLTLYADRSHEELEDMEVIKQIQVWSIILFSLIALASFFWQTIWVLRPIARLQKAAHNLSEGDYDTALPHASHDELGKLTQAFDTMRQQIKKSQLNLRTAMQALKDRENRQHAILETVPDAILSIDESGTIETTNSGINRLFYYSKNDVAGCNLDTLLSDVSSDSAKALPELLQKSLNPDRTSPNMEVLGRRKNNTTFPIELSINPMMIGDRHFFTVVLRDITERKKMERMKDDFISTISHELRTPLTAIKGSLGLIQGTFRKNLPGECVSLVDIANRNVERLLLLINDILDVSKLESDDINLHMNPLEIMPFIEQAIEINQSFAISQNTYFVCTQKAPGIYVNTDKDRLMQALSNLLSNAAKFSPENKAVKISVESENGSVTIKVKDYGPGIPNQFRNRIFDKFTQAETGNTRAVGGTGLGLNISKKIVEKLGGKIGFHTQSGKGTTFYISLPLETI